jgi:hypothetical protein
MLSVAMVTEMENILVKLKLITYVKCHAHVPRNQERGRDKWDIWCNKGGSKYTCPKPSGEQREGQMCNKGGY